MESLEEIYGIYKELDEARNDVNIARNDLEDAEYNYKITIKRTLKSIIGVDNTLDISKHCEMMNGKLICDIMYFGDDLRFTVMDYVAEKKVTCDITDFTYDELFNLTMKLLLLMSGRIKKEEEREKVSDGNTPHKDDDDVIDGLFWSTVQKVNWKDLVKEQDPCLRGKEIISKMGYNEDQLNELRKTYLFYRNCLVDTIRESSSGKDLGDDMIVRISDYIVSLGLDTFSDVYNDISDFMDYPVISTSLFINCFV